METQIENDLLDHIQKYLNDQVNSDRKINHKNIINYNLGVIGHLIYLNMNYSKCKNEFYKDIFLKNNTSLIITNIIRAGAEKDIGNIIDNNLAIKYLNIIMKEKRHLARFRDLLVYKKYNYLEDFFFKRLHFNNYRKRMNLIFKYLDFAKIDNKVIELLLLNGLDKKEYANKLSHCDLSNIDKKYFKYINFRNKGIMMSIIEKYPNKINFDNLISISPKDIKNWVHKKGRCWRKIQMYCEKNNKELPKFDDKKSYNKNPPDCVLFFFQCLYEYNDGKINSNNGNSFDIGDSRLIMIKNIVLSFMELKSFYYNRDLYHEDYLFKYIFDCAEIKKARKLEKWNIVLDEDGDN